MGTVVAAKETTLRELLEGSRQYLVPLYQRTYSWDQAQLTRLWFDICSLAEDRTAESSATHFMGSLVLGPSPTNGAVGVQQYLVVDGQQRLTTLTLLLCALRDRAKSAGDAQAWDRINESYLTNKFKPEHERLKLVPTQANVTRHASTRHPTRAVRTESVRRTGTSRRSSLRVPTLTSRSLRMQCFRACRWFR